jgi:hypothetical protein
VSLGVARDPQGERWVTDAQPLAAAGAVSVRAFLDLDGSGTWTEGDEPLEGVGFLVDRTVPRVRSDAAGVAFIGRLPAWRPVRVAVAGQTLEDPSSALPVTGSRSHRARASSLRSTWR